MKTLTIIEVNAYTRESDGVEMLAIQTAQGPMHTQTTYLNKKAKSIGKTVGQILGNVRAYELVASEGSFRVQKEGQPYSHKDKDGNVPEGNYKSNSVSGRFSLQLTQAGSMQQMVAESMASQMAASFGMSFNTPTQVEETKEVVIDEPKVETVEENIPVVVEENNAPDI